MSLAAAPLPAEEFEGRLSAEARRFGLSISSFSERQLALFLAELDLWRRRTNLTGPIGASELVVHALESALGASLVPREGRVIDIGSGAGFPGVPIALVRADVQMTLLEPRAKRIEFLRHAIRAVPIVNAQAVQSRLQSAGFDGLFDCAVVRAVGDLSGILGEAEFLRAGGRLLAWTTSPEDLARALPAFARGRVLPVPGARRKVIAEFLLTR